MIGTPAYLKRESVFWCYGEKCIERYCESKRVIEIFKVNRNYRQLLERLVLDVVYENDEYLPDNNNELEIIINENKGIKYLPVVEYYEDNYGINNRLMIYDTEINGTLLDRDWKYLCNNRFIKEYEYKVSSNKIYSLNKKLNRPKIRLLFNDGG